MESHTNIDYTEKIRTFQAMVDNYHEEIALNYLTKANWDETRAAQLYFNETTMSNRGSNINNLIESPHYIDDINYRDTRNSNRRSNNYERLSQNDNDMNANLIPPINVQRQEDQQPGFFTRWIVRPLAYLGSFFCNRGRDHISEEENRIFAELPERVNNLNSFSTLIKTKIGILVLYQHSDAEYFNHLTSEIKNQEYIMDILVK